MRLSCDKTFEGDGRANPLRRQMLLAVGATVLLEMFSVKGLVSEVFADDRAASDVRVSPEAAAFNAEKKIDEIEAKFSRLGDIVLPRLDQFVGSERIRVMIRAAFEVFEKNKTNPSRKSWQQEVVPYGKENGFFYIFCDMERSSMFNGAYRTLKLRPDFNPALIGRLSFLAHELVHVLKDDYYRRTVPESTYGIYWSSNFVAVPSEEADAIAVQLEILNIETKGEFKKNIMEGKSDCVKTGSKKADRFLIKMAELYFKGDWDNFVSFVEKWYRGKGAQIFNSDLTPTKI